MQHEETIVHGITLRIIREEHQALSAMLRSMLTRLRRVVATAAE